MSWGWQSGETANIDTDIVSHMSLGWQGGGSREEGLGVVAAGMRRLAARHLPALCGWWTGHLKRDRQRLAGCGVVKSPLTACAHTYYIHLCIHCSWGRTGAAQCRASASAVTAAGSVWQAWQACCFTAHSMGPVQSASCTAQHAAARCCEQAQGHAAQRSSAVQSGRQASSTTEAKPGNMFVWVMHVPVPRCVLTYDHQVHHFI